MLKLLVSEPCVRRFRHIETQSNHALTGAYVSNQSTNGGVRQQWFLCKPTVGQLPLLLLILIQVTGNLVFLSHQERKLFSMKNMLDVISCLLAY